MKSKLFPSLYQINTRVWLTGISRELGHDAILDDIPDTELDKLASFGFDWIWLLSVWQTGEAGRCVSRQNTEWRIEFQKTLPDLADDDIAGSGFAIKNYVVADRLGGNAALSRFRKKLQKRGMKLMLDFVPNHTALDHDWVNMNSDFYVSADEWHLGTDPLNYTRIKTKKGDIVFAHGRDPYFPGWPDTLQLNYGNSSLQAAMMAELLKVSEQCDGVRCDMAMLIDPVVFKKTWNIDCEPFWPGAIKEVKSENPDFQFMAEVYWNMEWELLQQGFDYCYDKRLYDRLKEGHSRPVLEHLFSDVSFQSKMAHFLENHDEPRAASAFQPGMHEAAAIIAYLSPGLRFFHDGQLTGKQKQISPHLIRGPIEVVNELLDKFYHNLLSVLKISTFTSGIWQLLECKEAWNGNSSNRDFLAFSWQKSDPYVHYLVVVNYSAYQGQCYVKIPFDGLIGKSIIFSDLFSAICFDRDGSEVFYKGLYIDEPAWKFYVFEIQIR
jgi:hypothetical protein